jgi:hypothetical protein
MEMRRGPGPLERLARLLALAAAVATLLLAPAAGTADEPVIGCEGITAEGFGAGAVGGRQVHVVESLDDSGPGSLREAVAGEDRCIVFAVAGEIVLQDHIWIRHPFLTIDGLTAPPPGITLVGRGLAIRGTLEPHPPPGFDSPADAHDVIVRGLRVRDSTEDNIQVAYGAYNVVIDRVSAGNPGDGNLDITFDAHDITVSRTIIGPGGKSMLIKYQTSRVSLHHNLFVQSGSRNPAVANDNAGTPAMDTMVDARNNVVWDWGTGSGTAVHHGARANVVGNLYVSPWSDATDGRRAVVVCPGELCPWSDAGSGAWAYVADNLVGHPMSLDVNSVGNAAAPFDAPALTTGPVCAAARAVLEQAGMRPLDVLDAALLAPISLDVCTGTSIALTTSSGSVALTEPVTFTATVAPIPPALGPVEGQVSFFADGALLGSGLLEGGSASFTTTALPAGTYSVVATYPGDGWLRASTASTVRQVVRSGYPSSTTLAVSASPTVLGQAVTFTASVQPVPPAPGPVTGNVRFRDGSTVLDTVSLVGGIAQFTTSALPAGERIVTAAFVGTSTFEPSTSPPLTVVVGGGSAVTVTASASTVQTGQPVGLTATVVPLPPETSTPAGVVSFLVGTTTLDQALLTQGQATSSAGPLAIGSNTITARYEGAAPFVPSLSTAITVKVVKGATATALGSSAPLAQIGDSVTLTATVQAVAPAQGVPTGTVKFRDGSTTLATVALVEGVAAFTTTQLAPGQRSLTAVYSGETRFSASTSPVLQQTIEGLATITARSSVNPSRVGQAVTLSATVDTGGGPEATGRVTFRAGTKVLGSSLVSSGVAAVTTTALVVGGHTISAAYEGDARYAAITAKFSQKVLKGATTTTAVTSDATATLGQSVTFTASVQAVAPAAGTPTGSVKFMAGGKSLGTASLSGGVARLTTTGLAAGQHTITAIYNGSSSFEKSTSPGIAQAVQ